MLRKDLFGQFTEDISLETSAENNNLNTERYLSDIYRKDLSGQFTKDISLETSAENINLNTLRTISLCAIFTGKIYLANLLKMSRWSPPPIILVLTCRRRYLSVQLIYERFIWQIY